ncbi:addiction module antidote protein [Hyphomicrobium sp. MC8b]|uniref:addiction module antidote protein n=1 Tax=Hyphomicrobium sp. MC8b TaxID=300273 RepID=UPI00391AB90B
MTKFAPFDPAKYLDSEEAIAAYLEAAAEGGDAKHFASALGDVARARNMTELARKSNMTRAGLYRAFSEDGNPSLNNTMSVLSALGLEFTVKPVKPAKHAARKRAATRA